MADGRLQFFNLVKAIRKQAHGTPMFITWGEQRAYPTDWLVEIDGLWRVLSDKKCKELLSEFEK